MRFAIAVGAVLFACGCADAESEVEPRVPVNAQFVEHEKMQAPDVRDGFDQAFAVTTLEEPAPRPVPSISLGFIGDQPIGVLPTPPYHPPDWTRPFPSRWLHDEHPYGCRGHWRGW